jgi:hypothetical protein
VLELVSNGRSWSKVVLGVTTLGLILPALSFGGASVSGATDPFALDRSIASPLMASAGLSSTTSEQDVPLLRAEVAIARRLLNIITDLDRAARTRYVERLEAILDTIPGGELRPTHCGPLGRAFLDARLALESTVPTLRDWITLARAIEANDSGRPLRTPSRFLRRLSPSTPMPLEVSASTLRVSAAIRSTLGVDDGDSRSG